MNKSEIPGPLKSVISAVGRSGTTIIHNLLLEIYADLYGADHDQLYEPFLWDSTALRDYPRNPAREGRFGDMGSVSPAGVYFHTELPLFMQAEDLPNIPVGLHAYLKAEASRPLVAKFIRANGRLPLLDHLYGDARFIILIRNPLDVVNSVITRFSFFGREHHKDDFPRFCRDVEKLYGISIPADAEQLPPAYRAALWCHFMNLHAVRHARDKANYLLITYEDFKHQREAYCRRICDHLGVTYKDTYGTAITTSVGQVSKGQPSLTEADVASIMPLFDEYWRMATDLSGVTPDMRQAILEKYSADQLPAHNPRERGFGWSPVRSEDEIIKAEETLRDQAAGFRRRIAEVQRASLAQTPKAPDSKIPVSVIVTSFNSQATIAKAVESVCRQTYPPEEIIIADDCSTDGSQDMIRSLATNDKRIKPIFREQNLGVSANRNDAIRNSLSSFVSQLDGDDAYDPGKLEREARSLMANTKSVAFSDTDYLVGAPVYWDCSWLAGLSGDEAISGIVSRRRPLPRDMLLSKELFFAAGGYREDCSIFEDWALKIRLADIAEDWRYSGGLGTHYRPGGLSGSGPDRLVTAGLWVLSTDVIGIIRKTGAFGAAFEGILNLLNVSYDPSLLEKDGVPELVDVKMTSLLSDICDDFAGYPDAGAGFSDPKLIGKVQRLINIIAASL